MDLSFSLGFLTMCNISPDKKQIFFLLSVLLVIVSSCPDGGFNCTSGECLLAGLVCDFKKDCEDGSDEEFCGSCDFEHHSCGWIDTSHASYCWRRQMANITSVPGLDHTTHTPFGHVMHIDGKQEGFLSVAKLEYSVDKLAALGCQIRFWYHIYNNKLSSSSSSYLELAMVRGSAEEKLLPDISKSMTDGWENATAFIGNRPGGYKLRFSFHPPFMDDRDVMLDDISFENCVEGDVPAGSDQLSCDFEKDTCSWYPDYTASLLWERINKELSEGEYLTDSK
ncbi:MAM and LDL-receptor class A domain-containing protein 1-like [Sander lucioperca]|uniref:MAM and LDL-receptor class A domain-containing protein 1-like n=1 Tax=Sander lucioperca TaxID=283035 RepID=UPI001653860D|nr:MAM and LDL-receptor class A domain-containing protein 1-like [Sander lucioperca]